MSLLKIHNKTESKSLMAYLREMGHILPSPCGGKGVCGKCRVKVTEGGTLSRPYTGVRGITLDEWEQGWRLACKIPAEENMVIELPEQANAEAEILTAGDYDVSLQPCISKVYVQLPKPSIEDQASDADRLERELSGAKIASLELIRELPGIIRDNDYKVTAVIYENEIIAVEGGNTANLNYGIAVDVGTTTIAAVLIDLNTGDEMGVFTSLNPQKAHGDDVISRIDYTIENEDGLQRLRDLIIGRMNDMLDYFEKQHGISSKNIYHINIAGNTVMMHLFAGVSVRSIASSPFTPVMTYLPETHAEELGIKANPACIISSLPMVAGYIGADTLSCILSSDMVVNSGISLMIDIGTNGEIALGNNDRIVACATAAGPALEGAHIQCGMGGIGGAVNKVSLNDTGVEFTTIGSAAARGICGSGIVDAVAQMLDKGLVESYGRMLFADEARELLPEKIASRCSEYANKPCFMIVSKDEGAETDIFVTQKDIREIQLAKAAIAAGIRILMSELGIEFGDIEHVYLAGGFGNYIDQAHAMRIGLIPAELKGKIVPVGNAALSGSKMVVKSWGYMERAGEIRQKTQYVELSTRLDFQTIFVDNMEF